MIDQVINFFKYQILAKIRSFLVFENWPYWLAVILVFFLGMYIYRRLRNRKRKSASKSEAAAETSAGRYAETTANGSDNLPPQEAQPPPEKELPASSLLKIWKRFLKGLPAQFRRLG